MSGIEKYGSKLDKWLKITALLLIILLLAYTLTMFFIIRSRVDTYTRQLYDDIAAMYGDEISMVLEVNETIPVDLSIPVSDLVDMSKLIPSDIPFEATIPIDTVVRINQNISVPLDIPLLGSYIVNIPLKTEIPINQEMAISTKIKIDSTAFQLSEDVINIKQDIPISIPLELQIPINELGLSLKTEGFSSLINLARFLLLLKPIELEL